MRHWRIPIARRPHWTHVAQGTLSGPAALLRPHRASPKNRRAGERDLRYVLIWRGAESSI